MKADAVFEGGGMKAIGLVGALTVAESLGYRWVNVAGTSAGAMVAALVAAGYTARELAQIIGETDFTRFQDPPPWGRIPLVGPFLSLLIDNGLYRGDALEDWMAQLLEARGVRTFADLEMKPEPGIDVREPRFRYRLQVIAADISRGRMLVLPRDLGVYGLDPGQVSVARAVRWSASLPFFYRPGRIRARDGTCYYVVDGGLLSNFPVWLFDVPGPPPWPTFGFHLVDPQLEGKPRYIRGPISLLSALVATMLEAHDARHIEEADFARTIAIPTMGVGTADFRLSRQQMKALFDAGVRAAEKFFSSWDFAAYVQCYRMGKRAG